MMKGGSHSIQKVLRGEAKKKKGVSRFDRRKMHFKNEKGSTQNPSFDGDESQSSIKSSDSAPKAPTRRRQEDESEVDLEDDADLEDEDAEIIAEADKRSKFMSKGGSYSIQKVLRGEARTKKEGITRFDRRKMHFKHESEAIHSHDNDPKRKDQPPKRPPGRSSEPSQGEGEDSEFDEEELRLLAEAENDPRSQMMLKGASHSIRNIFSGKAKKKEKTGEGMERRKSQLKNASMRGLSDDAETAGPDEESSVSQSQRADEDAKGDKDVDRRSKFTLKGASNSIRNLLGRKPSKSTKKEGQKAMDAEIERLQALEQSESKFSDADLDDEDREIEEEANRRSNFMAKGGSYSIQKVLKGSARKKKDGITRFDRRKMHFKHESEAIHSHDNDDKPASLPASAAEAADPSPEKLETDAANDKDADLDDEDADIIEEADKRSKFMSKGGSYSIQKVLKGEARSKKGVTRFDRRKMHFKKESEAIHCHDGDASPKRPSTSDSAPSAPKRPVSSSANAKMPSRRGSDGMEDEQAEDTQTDLTVSPKREELVDDVQDDDDDEVDRRSRFTLKGASHSIKKVLSGKARAKKESGVSRLDRRRIHLKSKSTPRADMDVPSNVGK